ncbi:MAG: hypothetical protein IJ744_05980 [Lachnospiraceae bacterium]|nr:hypothetical protein [Lachnospiraceae bacterium]
MTCRHGINKIIWLIFFSLLLLTLVACGRVNNIHVDSDIESSENTTDITSELATETTVEIVTLPSIHDLEILLYDEEKEWYYINEEVYHTKEYEADWFRMEIDVEDPSVIDHISTENLLDICLNNHNYQTVVSLYDETSQEYNIRECAETSFMKKLLEREDLHKVLFEAYKTEEVSLENVDKLRLLESLIGSPEVFPSFNEDELQMLSEISRIVIEKKSSLPDMNRHRYFLPELVKYNGWKLGYRPNYEILVSEEDEEYQAMIEDWNKMFSW